MDKRKAESECLTISVEATAKILGISRGLAYSMIHEKRIPALYFGRCIRVPKAALERLLEAEIIQEHDYSAAYR